MGDIIKDTYFALEDRYYSAMDWLDTHGLPVYKVVDPIDKIIPSFALFGLLILLLLLFGITAIFGVGGIFSGGDVPVAFQLVNEDGEAIANVAMSFTYAGKTQLLTSNSQGIIAFSVPAGTKINYELKDPKYDVVKSSITPTEKVSRTIELRLAGNDTKTKTIKLVNSLNQPIVSEAFLTFACATAYGIAPDAISGTGGTFTVTPNTDCDPLIVSVQVDGYEDVQSFRIVRDVQPIVLQERQTVDAVIQVLVQDEQGNALAGMDVSVQRNGIADERRSDAGGGARFDVSAGEYTVNASDPNGIYVFDSDVVSVASQSTSNVTLTLRKDAAGSISVKVTDKTTGNALKGAIVKLKQGNTIVTTRTIPDTSTDGIISIPIPDRTQQYIVSASKDGYVPKQVAVAGNTTATTALALEKFNGRNGAKLKVLVTDQDNDPVPDATVVLYDGETGFLSAYEPRVSDVNGVATFSNVVSGNYEAFASKATLSGKTTAPQFFDIADPDTQTLSIRMQIPSGDIRVHVVDNDGSPVSFARVTVINAITQKNVGAELTDNNGTFVLPQNQQKIKADKDVYLRVEKTGFATLITAAKPIIPDGEQSFEVVLPPVRPSGNIEIQLQGIYLGDKLASGVGRNKAYTAKFRVYIPEEHDDLETLEVHLRTGENDIVEKDDWYIGKVNFPRAHIVKGSAWDPNNGLNIDNESITFGPAKWINAELPNPNPGVYEMEAILHVRDTATAQDVLKLFYKARGEDGETLRDPVDSNPTEELYANTKLETVTVGATTLCDTQFCFDASILDIKEKRIEDVVDSFAADVFKDYKLQFTLQNNGNAFHTNSNLRIKASNDGINFQTYEIFTADNLKLSGTINDNEFASPLQVGNFTPGKKVVGSVFFRTQNSGTTTITLELVSDFKSVFSKTFTIVSTASKNLLVEVQPEFYPSQIPIELRVDVKDEATGEEVKDAMVRLSTNTGITLATKLTDAAGHADITLPGQFPGKKIKLTVEKAEYNTFAKELPISDKILAFNPNPVGISINAKTESEKTTTIEFKNETNLPIILQNLEIQGNLLGLLDRSKINSSLQAYVGRTIPANSTLAVQLRSPLTQEGIAITEHHDIEATLAVTAENYGWPWVFELPLRYSLGISSEVDDPTCFKTVPNSWKSSTDGTTISYEFQIQNNCSIKSNPTALQNLEAKANWNGNELGETLLTVFRNDKPNAIGAAKVRGGYFSKFLPAIAAQDTLTARLDFTPYGGVKGIGKVDFIIQATNPLEGKPQLVNSTIMSELTVSNLAECIIFDKELLDLTPEKEDKFVITTKACGNPVEFTLDSDLELSSETFTLQGDDKKEIVVRATNLDLGQYPITIKTEGNQEKLKSQQKILKARIRDPAACLQLSRYEFDVYDDQDDPFDGLDTARLENLCVQQIVPVKVVVPKSFWDSLKTGLLIGGASALITALSDDGEEEGTTTSTSTSSTTVNNTNLPPAGSTPPAAAPPSPPADGEGPPGSRSIIGAPAPSAPISGLVTLLQVQAQNNQTPEQRTQQLEEENARLRNQAQQRTAGGGALGGIGGLFGGISNLVSLGTGNPLISFGVGTAVGTLASWLLSEDKEFEATVKGKDVTIERIFVTPVLADPLASIEDNDIEVKQSGAALVPKIPLAKPVVSGKVEATNLTFTNKSGFVDDTIYRNLVIEGKRYEYKQNEKYDDKIPSPSKLKTEKIEDVRVKFHLEFNSIAPDDQRNIVQPPVALSCDTFSEKTGKTGFGAAPKIAFNWDFTRIPENACDVGRVDTQGNAAHIYCDATQFSIEVIKKVQLLRQFIEANAPFMCPIQDALTGYKTQPIVAADIGISSIGIDRINNTDVNVQVGIENKTPVQNNSQLSITYQLIGTPGTGTTQQRSVLVPVGGSKISVGFVLSNLAAGNYTITADLVPQTCTNCSNSAPASDTITTQFSIGTGSNGLVACEPYTTTRLQEYIQAAGGSGTGTGTGGGNGNPIVYPAGLDKDSVLALVNFKAHLMPDRFSNDFYADFDRYAKKVSFFDAPTYYLNDSDGLHRYFTDRERWVINREGIPVDALGYKVPSPGIYQVTIDINFDEPEMRFFKNGSPSGYIKIFLEKSSSIDDQESPFYSLPFDGLVGTDDGQGRVGYGVNYSGEVVNITSTAGNQVSTIDITGSTPVSSLATTKTDSFKTLNSTERGNLLSLTKNGTSDFALKWSPSYATPILMNISTQNIKSNVYGYYSVGVNNDTSQSYIGAQGNPWYGVGASCRDFEDNAVLDAFDRRYDTSAINADCGLVGPQKNIAYGFEWCNDTSNIHKGTVTLKSIFYTPQGSASSIAAVAANDSISVVGEGSGGSTLPLNGSNVLSNNSPGNDLKSLEEILQMVTAQEVCVRNSGSKTEFFWNPKEVFNAIVAQEKAAEAACIKG
ncbi:MAG: hypothetical protein IPJ89_02645 [Candidatus Iainarchaeum archaeon]|uniref:Carboxypeptidase regulatory-like domain-containing protein n=1 Tax=Candidatus Iainarchaeum sp. TaxID=3101447 RepID=A0A7T9I282_9ARCH|nr:MAG: hypothetical protein IPJ89_02645 [Candidatus Diapherotrites archaeon]